MYSSSGGSPEVTPRRRRRRPPLAATSAFQVARSADGHTWPLERTVVNSPVHSHPIVRNPSFVAGAGLFVVKTGG